MEISQEIQRIVKDCVTLKMFEVNNTAAIRVFLTANTPLYCCFWISLHWLVQ